MIISALSEILIEVAVLAIFEIPTYQVPRPSKHGYPLGAPVV